MQSSFRLLCDSLLLSSSIAGGRPACHTGLLPLLQTDVNTVSNDVKRSLTWMGCDGARSPQLSVSAIGP